MQLTAILCKSTGLPTAGQTVLTCMYVATKVKAPTTTPFDMVVMNDLERFQLANDVINRLRGFGSKGAYTKQWLQNKLLNHKAYISIHGEDMPEILN